MEWVFIYKLGCLYYALVRDEDDFLNLAVTCVRHESIMIGTKLKMGPSCVLLNICLYGDTGFTLATSTISSARHASLT